MENNNVVNLLVLNKENGSIGIDQQLFDFLKMLITQSKKEESEAKAARRQQEASLLNLEIELKQLEIDRQKFQIEKDRFFFDMEKADRLSRPKREREAFNK